MKTFFFSLSLFILNLAFAQDDYMIVEDYDENEKIWVGPVDTIESYLPNAHFNPKNDLILYQKNGLWGLADENANVIVEPNYDDIYQMTSAPYSIETNMWCSDKGINFKRVPVKTQFYRTINKYKSGVITAEKIIIPIKYEYIEIIHHAFFYTGRRSGDLYNLKGELLLTGVQAEIAPIHLNTFADKNQFVFGVSSTEKNGFFLYDFTEQKIVKWFDVSYKNDLEVLVCSREMRYYVWQDNGNYVDHYKVIAKNKTLQFEPIAKEIIDKEWEAAQNDANFKTRGEIDRFESETKGQKQSHPITAVYRSLILTDGQLYFVQKINGYNYQLTPKHDTIPLMGTFNKITIQPKPSASWHSTIPFNKDDLEEVDTVYLFKGYATYTKKKKQGILIDNRVLPAQYDSICLVRIGGLKPFFLVSKSTKKESAKWGMINIYGEEIIPIKYDSIHIPKRANTTFGVGSTWLVEIGDKKGLIKNTGEIVVPAECDQIEKFKSSNTFIIYKDGKHGAYRSGDYVAPTFDYRISPYRNMEINGVQYYMVIDEAGKEQGYINENGLRFFE